MLTKSNPDNIIKLIRLAQSGNEEAMMNLILLFKPLIKKISSKAHPNDQEDIEQELYYTMVKAVLKFQINP